MFLLSHFVISSLLGISLFCQPIFTASHHNGDHLNGRDEPGTTGDSAILQPVIPPEVSPDVLTNLALSPDVKLAWAGSSTASTRRRLLKRAGAVFAEAESKFRYPVVPLDHSAFVSGIVCSAGQLTATLTDVAYNYAKRQWTGAGDIVFITSVDGCGNDDENDFFHATTLTFTDSSKSFSAKGSTAEYVKIISNMRLKWGEVGARKLTRAVDKSEVRTALLSDSPPAKTSRRSTEIERL